MSNEKTFPLIRCISSGRKWYLDFTGAIERHLGQQKRGGEVFLTVSSVKGASKGLHVLVKGSIIPKPKMSVVRPLDVIGFQGPREVKYGGLYLVKTAKK